MKTFANIKPVRITLLSLLVAVCFEANAQFDPMFTQYMNNEMFINPAYTGTRKALAINMLYRNQWVGIDGAPKTQTFSAHAPLDIHNGVGVAIMNESIGITHQMRVMGNYSYRIKTGNFTKLSFGLQGGLVNLRERYEDLTLISQTDNVFTPNMPSVFAPNVGFGMFFYSKEYYIGLSIPRMIKNKVQDNGSSYVKNSASPSDWHYFLTSAYVFDASEDIKVKPSIMIKYVSGAPVQAEFNMQALFAKVWWIGAGFRSGDALSAMTGFNISNQFKVLYSYDYSITPLRGYNAGTHEITLGYDFAFKRQRISSPRLF